MYQEVDQLTSITRSLNVDVDDSTEIKDTKKDESSKDDYRDKALITSSFISYLYNTGTSGKYKDLPDNSVSWKK